MTEANVTAKEPDNKSDWASLDIFLFSNGQHYSPPRKYHLMTNQLEWWNNTLTFLAKSQFGSLHNMIDLYTIDGTKVETPLQLKHNAAYVAAIPPEYFINASYEKYLIKATRSWEKRQAKRSSNTSISKQEEYQDLEDKSNSDNRESELTHMKAIRDGSVTLKTIVASTVDNQLSEIVKPHNQTPERTTNTKSSINPMKQSDKINRLSTQRPALVKNINSSTSSSKSRKPPIKMKDCVKINTNSAFGRPLNSNNKLISRDKIFKPLQKIQDLPEPALIKVEQLSKLSTTKLTNKTSLTKTLGIENEILGKDSSVATHIYKNPQSEKPSIALPANLRLSTVSSVNRQGGAHELFDGSYPPILLDNIDNEEFSINAVTASSLESKTYNPPPRSKDLFIPPDTSILTKPEYNVDHINKDGTVNLKLNIEIWNAPNEAKYSHFAANRESFCALHTEKGSQVEIEDKTLDQHKTLQKTIERELYGNEGNNKVIVVKCSCLNQCCDGNIIKTEIEQNTKNNMFRVNNTNSKILIFLPVLKLDENCKRCDCNKEHKETNNSIQNPTIDQTIKKTDKNASCISLYKAKMDKMAASHAEIFSRNNSIEIKVETNDKTESTLVKRKSVAIREDLILPGVENVKQPSKGILDESSKILPKVQEPMKVLMKEQEPSKVSVKVQEPPRMSLKPHECMKIKPQEPAFCIGKQELLVFKDESTGRMHTSSNKSTQTEYCDVLVEARLQSDGHYSFYLPPLNIVKNYKL